MIIAMWNARYNAGSTPSSTTGSAQGPTGADPTHRIQRQAQLPGPADRIQPDPAPGIQPHDPRARWQLPRFLRIETLLLGPPEPPHELFQAQGAQR